MKRREWDDTYSQTNLTAVLHLEQCASARVEIERDYVLKYKLYSVVG